MVPEVAVHLPAEPYPASSVPVPFVSSGTNAGPSWQLTDRCWSGATPKSNDLCTARSLDYRGYMRVGRIGWFFEDSSHMVRQIHSQLVKTLVRHRCGYANTQQTSIGSLSSEISGFPGTQKGPFSGPVNERLR